MTSRQIHVSVAQVGAEGTLEAAPSPGSWETKTPTREVYPLIQALAESGTGRLDLFKDALTRGLVSDLRLADPLLEGLNDGFGELADLIAAEALPKFGQSILPDLKNHLRLDGKKSDGRRLMAICRISREAGAKLCRTVLAEGNATLRLYATTCLPEVAPAEEVVQVAIRILAGKAPNGVSVAAIKALGDLGPAGKDAVPILVGLLGHMNVFEALGKIGEPAVPDLIQALQAVEDNTRRATLRALEEMGPVAAPAVPALIAFVADKNPEIRRGAMNVLRSIGKKAAAAVPNLAKALQDKQVEVRAAAACALFSVAGETKKTVPVLADALKCKDSSISEAASKVFREMGSQAEPAVPALIDAIKGSYGGCVYVQGPCVEALVAIGKQSDCVAKALLKILDDEDEQLRRYASYIFSQIGPTAKFAVPHYIKQLQHKNAARRRDAVDALGDIQADPATAVAALVEALRDKNEHVRRWSAISLAKYGPRAKNAVPALSEAINDSDKWVANEAAKALTALEGK